MKYRKRVYKRKPRSNRRRSRRTRGGRRGAATGIVRVGAAIPDRMLLKLKYQETVSLTSTTGALYTYLFKGNDLNDPNYTGTGHQPLGYDEWSNFYERYMVYGSKIKLHIVNEGTGAVVVNLFPKVTSADPSVGAIQEKPYNRRKILSIGQEDVFTMSNYMTTAKLLGSRKIDSSEDSYGALVGSSPSRTWYWFIGANSMNGSGTNTIRVDVTITYYCQMMSRKSLTQS